MIEVRRLVRWPERGDRIGVNLKKKVIDYKPRTGMVVLGTLGGLTGTRGIKWCAWELGLIGGTVISVECNSN